MKNNGKLTLAALVLCVSALFMPMTAYAADTDTTPPTCAAWVSGDTLYIEASDDDSGVDAVYVDGKRINYLVNGAVDVKLKDYAGNAEQVSVYAVDFEGNKSTTVKIKNPYYTAPASSSSPTTTPTTPTQPTQPSPASQPASAPSSSSSTSTPAASSTPEPTESAVPDDGINPLTPEGQANVVDVATDEDGKEFYTITTPAGNVFYLIIDHERTDGGVYFLNAVTEADLLALAEDADSGITAIPAPEPEPTPEPVASEPEPTPEPEPEPEESGGMGSIIFIIIGVLAVGGAGYYFKILRPKQQAAEGMMDDDYEDEYGEEGEDEASGGDGDGTGSGEDEDDPDEYEDE